jgi:hypothetical protein
MRSAVDGVTDDRFRAGDEDAEGWLRTTSTHSRGDSGPARRGVIEVQGRVGFDVSPTG